MGLDQYLYAKKYVSKTEWNAPEENETYDKIISAFDIPNVLDMADKTMSFQSVEVGVKVAYWRKANAIHYWFVENVQDGEDDCGNYYVSHDALAELLSACEEVLAHRGTEDSEAEAELTLPSVSGFFFGSTEYDEYYYETLEYTVTVLKVLLNDEALNSWSFSYSSSW